MTRRSFFARCGAAVAAVALAPFARLAPKSHVRKYTLKVTMDCTAFNAALEKCIEASGAMEARLRMFEIYREHPAVITFAK